jgi:hypothetical protein
MCPDGVVMHYRLDIIAAPRAVEPQHDLVGVSLEDSWAYSTTYRAGGLGLDRQGVVEFHESPHGPAMFLHPLRGRITVTAGLARVSLENIVIGNSFYHIVFLL